MDSMQSYHQISFQKIPESFPKDCDLECIFTRVHTFETSTKDWVGLYKVGWTSSKEHITYEWVTSATTTSENQYKLIFKVGRLPKDDGEFYQFCYVTGSGHVRGVSSPFQFKEPQVEDFVEIEDLDDDIMIIKSRTSALQDELYKVVYEKNTAMQQRDKRESDIRRMKLQLEEIKQDLNEETQIRGQLERALKDKEEELKSLHQSNKDVSAVNDDLREKTLQVTEEKAAVARQLEDRETYVRSLQEKIKSLVSEKDSLVGRCRMLEEEKDLYKDNFASSESTVSGYVKEIEHQTHQLAALTAKADDLEALVEEKEMEVVHAKKDFDGANSCLEKFKTDIEVLREQLVCSEEKIQALEQCKKSLGADLDALQLTNAKLSADVEHAQSELHSTKLKFERLSEEHQMKIQSVTGEIVFLDEKLAEQTKENRRLDDLSVSLKLECDELREERIRCHGDSGALVALQSALESLRKRLEKSEKDRSKLERETSELVKYKTTQELRESELTRSVTDMKERLKMCQQEFQDQYLESMRVKKKLKQMEREMTPPLYQVETVTKTPASADDEALLSVSELQMQMQSLAAELENRRAKCDEYKALYRDEVAKRRDVERRRREAEKEIVLLRNNLEVAKASLDKNDVVASSTPAADMREVTREFDPLMARAAGESEVFQTGFEDTPAPQPQAAERSVPVPPQETKDTQRAPQEQSMARGGERSLLSGSNACPLCMCVITDSDVLQRHVDAHFAGASSARVCPMCDRLFNEHELDALQEHVNSHLDETIQQ